MRRAAAELDAVLRGRRAQRVWFRFARLRAGGITNAPSIAARLRRGGVPYAAYRHYVFDREDGHCHRCASPIARIVHTGRQLYLCATCQPPPVERA